MVTFHLTNRIVSYTVLYNIFYFIGSKIHVFQILPFLKFGISVIADILQLLAALLFLFLVCKIVMHLPIALGFDEISYY